MCHPERTPATYILKPPTGAFDGYAENEGGQGASAIIEFLRTHFSDREADGCTFLDSLAFNWLAAGTDAHAKNFSLLIGSAGCVRLAPLYDLASALSYDDMHLQNERVRLYPRMKPSKASRKASGLSVITE